MTLIEMIQKDGQRHLYVKSAITDEWMRKGIFFMSLRATMFFRTFGIIPGANFKQISHSFENF